MERPVADGGDLKVVDCGWNKQVSGGFGVGACDRDSVSIDRVSEGVRINRQGECLVSRASDIACGEDDFGGASCGGGAGDLAGVGVHAKTRRQRCRLEASRRAVGRDGVKETLIHSGGGRGGTGDHRGLRIHGQGEYLVSRAACIACGEGDWGGGDGGGGARDDAGGGVQGQTYRQTRRAETGRCAVGPDGVTERLIHSGGGRGGTGDDRSQRIDRQDERLVSRAACITGVERDCAGGDGGGGARDLAGGGVHAKTRRQTCRVEGSRRAVGRDGVAEGLTHLDLPRAITGDLKGFRKKSKGEVHMRCRIGRIPDLGRPHDHGPHASRH